MEQPGKIIVSGHRGDRVHGMENTMAAMRLAVAAGVDMIETDFMVFPVFNIADCFITCSAFLLLAHLFLFNKEFWKEEKKK